MELLELLKWLNDLDSADKEQQALKTLADQVIVNQKNIDTLFEAVQNLRMSNLGIAAVLFLVLILNVYLVITNKKQEKQTNLLNDKVTLLEKLMENVTKTVQKS